MTMLVSKSSCQRDRAGISLKNKKRLVLISCTRGGFLSAAHEVAVFSGTTTGYKHVWPADTWPEENVTDALEVLTS